MGTLDAEFGLLAPFIRWGFGLAMFLILGLIGWALTTKEGRYVLLAIALAIAVLALSSTITGWLDSNAIIRSFMQQFIAVIERTIGE